MSFATFKLFIFTGVGLVLFMHCKVHRAVMRRHSSLYTLSLAIPHNSLQLPVPTRPPLGSQSETESGGNEVASHGSI